MFEITHVLFVLVSIVCAVVAALIVAHWQSKTHLRAVKLQIEAQRSEKEADLLQGNRLFFLKKLETAHLLCSQISMFNSKTTSFIEWDGCCLPDKWDKKYQRQQIKLDTLQMIIDLYFSTLSEACSNMKGASNCFWMAQRNLMVTNEAQNKAGRDYHLQKTHEHSEEVSAYVLTVKRGLTQYAEEIGLDI